MSSATSDKVPTVGGFFLSKRQAFRASTIMIVLAVSILTAKNRVSYDTLHSLKESKWVIHLFAFACFYGCSMWVTFVAGLVMFKSLPRHVFGKLQSKLFPRYFQFSIMWIGLCLGMELWLLLENRSSETNLFLPREQSHNLLYIMVTLLVNLYVLEPKTTKCMFKRHIVERKMKTGHEVGILKPAESILKAAEKEDIELLSSLSKEFGKLHGISASLNLLTLILGTWHLCWLGNQIHL